MSLSERVRDVHVRCADDVAFETGHTPLRWRDVARFASALEQALLRSGAPAHDAVAVVAHNRVDVACALIALFGLGRRAVILSAHLPPARLATEMSRVDAAAVLAPAFDWTAETKEAATLRGMAALQLVHSDTLTEPEVLWSASTTRAAPGAPSDIALDLNTSGTTGAPKRVALRASTAEQAALSEEEVVSDMERGQPAARQRLAFINFYPLSNIAGLYFLLHAAISGRPTLLLARFAVQPWLHAVRKIRPLVLYIPPAAIAMVVEAEVAPADLAGALIMRTGNAPLPIELRDRFERVYGIPVFSHYGATEFCGVVTTWTQDDQRRFAGDKRGSLGRARTRIVLRTVDAGTGTALPPGEIGLLEVQAERVGPQWIRTTDLAQVDREGFLRIVGRADDAINRGGFKIIPDQVAQLLARHPAVLEAVVVGVPDAVLGQVPVAALVARPGVAAPGEAELAAWARTHCAAYQVPVRMLWMDALPRTPSLKPDRGHLRAMFETLFSKETT